MQKIQVKGTVNVEELASELNVTPLTIRRDLQYWERHGELLNVSMVVLNLFKTLLNMT